MKTTAAIIEKRLRATAPTHTGRRLTMYLENLADSLLHTHPVPTVSATVIKNSDKISVKETGLEYSDGVHHLLTDRGLLEFWDTYENEEIFTAMVNADKALSAALSKEPPVKAPPVAKKNEKSFFDDAVVAVDTTSGKSKKIAVQMEAKVDAEFFRNPLFKVLSPLADANTGIYPGPAVGVALGKDTALIDGYLSRPSVRACFPLDVKFLWGSKPVTEGKDVYQLFAIRVNLVTGTAPISGDVFTESQVGVDVSGMPDVTLTMNSYGAARWEKMTDEAAHSSVNGKDIHRCIAIVLNDRVLSVPRVMNKISGGHTQLTGLGSAAAAADLSALLAGGVLPAPVRIVEEHALRAGE